MFNDIIELLSNQIEEQERKLKTLEKSYEEAKEAKRLKDERAIVTEYKKGEKLYPDVYRFQGYLKAVTETIKKVDKKDFKSINIDFIVGVLKGCGLNYSDIAEKIECCSKLCDGKKDEVTNKIYESLAYDIVRELQLANNSMINMVPIAIINTYETKYRDVCEHGQERIDKITKKIDELKEYATFFKEDGKDGYFESRDNLEKFVNGWLKDNVEIRKQIELLHEINKINLERRTLAEEEEIASEIDENNENVLKALEEEVKPKEIRSIDDIDEEEFALEDRETIREFKRIYKYFDSKNVLRTKSVLSLDATEEERRKYYTQNHCYQLGAILGDLDENLIPNIRTEKDKLVEIVKILSEIEIKDREQEKVRNLIKAKYVSMIFKLSKHDNVCKRMKTQINDGRLDYVLDMEHDSVVNGVHVEDIELNYFVREKVAPIKELVNDEYSKVKQNASSRKELSEDEITTLMILIVDILGVEASNMFIDELKKEFIDAELFRYTDEPLEEKPCCAILEEKALLYHKAHGDEYIEEPCVRKQHPYQEQLLFAIRDLPQRVYDDKAACEEVSQTIVDFKDQKAIKDNDDLTEHPRSAKVKNPPLMIRNYENVSKIFSHVTGNYRGGVSGRAIVVQLEPSEQVRDELQKAYNLGSSFRVCVLADALSIANANHHAYEEIVDPLRTGEYHDQIQLLANKIHSTEPNMDELISIIDAGLELKETIKSRLDNKKENVSSQDNENTDENGKKKVRGGKNE